MKFLPSLLLMVVLTVFWGNSFASHIYFDKTGAGQKENKETKVNSYKGNGIRSLSVNIIDNNNNLKTVPLYNCKFSDNSKKIYCLFSKNPNHPSRLTHYVEYPVKLITKMCSSTQLNKYNNNYYFPSVVVDDHRLGNVNIDTNRCSSHPITFEFLYKDNCDLKVKTTGCIIYNK